MSLSTQGLIPRLSGWWSVICDSGVCPLPGECPWPYFGGFFWPEWGLELWQPPPPAQPSAHTERKTSVGGPPFLPH